MSVYEDSDDSSSLLLLLYLQHAFENICARREHNFHNIMSLLMGLLLAICVHVFVYVTFACHVMSEAGIVIRIDISNVHVICINEIVLLLPLNIVV